MNYRDNEIAQANAKIAELQSQVEILTKDLEKERAKSDYFLSHFCYDNTGEIISTGKGSKKGKIKVEFKIGNGIQLSVDNVEPQSNLHPGAKVCTYFFIL